MLLKVQHKQLKLSEFAALIDVPNQTLHGWIMNGSVPLMGRRMGLAEQKSSDGRVWRVYLQPDVLLTAVAHELTRDSGFSWQIASCAVNQGWDVIFQAADTAENARPPVWIAINESEGEIKVGTFEELSVALGKGDGRWRLALVNLTTIIARIRERAAKAGIELTPLWLQEPSDEALAGNRARRAELLKKSADSQAAKAMAAKPTKAAKAKALPAK